MVKPKTGRDSQTKARAATTVAVELEAVEEKVVRMRVGAQVPDDWRLERVGQDRPDVRAKLLEIEMRALRESGRFEELQREAAIEPSTKTKIIQKLGTRKKTH